MKNKGVRLCASKEIEFEKGTYATPSKVVAPPQPIMMAAKVVADMTNLRSQNPNSSFSIWGNGFLPHQAQWSWVRETLPEIPCGCSFRREVELLEELGRNRHRARGFDMREIGPNIFLNATICALPMIHAIGSHCDTLESTA